MHPIWQSDITYLKKVGPVRAEALKRECAIATYADLLQYFPRKYVDRSQVTPISSLTGEEAFVTLVGKVSDIQLLATNKGKGRLAAQFTDGTGVVELTWFQGIKWVQSSLKAGEEIALFGRPNVYNGRISIAHPEIDHLKAQDDQPAAALGIVPFYSSSEKLQRIGLDSRGFRGIVAKLLDETLPYIEENLPPDLLHHFRLMPRQEAYRQVHFPETKDKLHGASRRLKFEELFFFQLMLARRRASLKLSRPAAPFAQVGAAFLEFYEKHLPFQLTNAQKRVMKEVRGDLAKPVQMNRLIQGDVGSGKTIIAFLTMLLAHDNGFQSALMAPTAILAEQHGRKIGEMARNLRLKTALLVGGQGKREREAILASIASGEVRFVIGTHALIEDTVVFERLGLVVIDEQHKFGVLQRARLWEKADPYPHNMVMTATPIPRTLAMSLYGDVDVSVIDELPPGRKPISTYVFSESQRLMAFGLMKRELAIGRQVYVVYPLVEESEKVDLLAVTRGMELIEQSFPDYRVGIVHGQMKPEDKELEMSRFIKRETHILVSTTVIEVGVDVPNASVMMVENAERFGLSQLHQLRGRVGRGADQSYCLLMHGNKLTHEGKRRLDAMRETNDGFRIAEIDLELRGPGDFLGTRQSGLPDFSIANIVTDQPILVAAREAAFALIEADPELADPAHLQVKRFLTAYLQKHAALSGVA